MTRSTWPLDGDEQPYLPADTVMRALMEAAPGEQPSTAYESGMLLREVIVDAIDAMSERDRWIFEGLVYRRLSLRQLGRELGLSKSYIFKRRNEILAHLRAALQDHPLIQEALR